LSTKDVDQLREFIELEVPKQRTGPSDPRVPANSDRAAGFMHTHRAQLHHLERHAIHTDALLPEHAARTGGDRSCQPSDAQAWREDHQQKPTEDEIECPLDTLLTPAQPSVRHSPTWRGLARSDSRVAHVGP